MGIGGDTGDAKWFEGYSEDKSSNFNVKKLSNLFSAVELRRSSFLLASFATPSPQNNQQVSSLPKSIGKRHYYETKRDSKHSFCVFKYFWSFLIPLLRVPSIVAAGSVPPDPEQQPEERLHRSRFVELQTRYPIALLPLSFFDFFLFCHLTSNWWASEGMPAFQQWGRRVSLSSCHIQCVT